MGSPFSNRRWRFQAALIATLLVSVKGQSPFPANRFSLYSPTSTCRTSDTIGRSVVCSDGQPVRHCEHGKRGAAR